MADEIRIRAMAMEIAIAAMQQARRWVTAPNDDRDTAFRHAEVCEKYFSVAAWALEVATEQAGSDEEEVPLADAPDLSPGQAATHVLNADQPYFGNPAQAMAPDGTLPAGTRCVVLRPAGSYSQIRTDEGVVAYVLTKSLQAISN